MTSSFIAYPSFGSRAAPEPRAFSSEVGTGSREENATKQRVGVARRFRETMNCSKGKMAAFHGLDKGFHEFVDGKAGSDVAAVAFAMALSARVWKRTEKAVCLCSLTADAQERGAAYGYGLRELGLPSDKVLIVSAEKEKHLLWTLEEALASKAFGAVIGVLGTTERLYAFPASRRLKLRVVENQTPLYLLRHHSRGGATAAHGRWRIEPAPSHAAGTHAGFELPGPPRLRLSLEKMGGLPPQQWEVDYDVAGDFRMAALLPDRADRAADGGRRQAV